MAKLGISTGTTPNDGLGDNLLAGAVKINSNFSEIYTQFGDGTNLTAIGGTWTSTSAGIHTLKNVGIGTTNPRFLLEVGAVGASGTTLFVNGDARITGIVTIGPASITLDGTTNIINVGTGITINGSTGIISATSIVLGGTTITGAGVTSITAGSGISVDQSTGNVTITATGGGSSQWVTTAAGIHTLSNVGIGTTNPTSALTVTGDGTFTGVVTATTFVGALTGTATSTTNIPNLTGDIISNGTSASLGSFTSTALRIALTSSTGTGDAVFATSPTFATPALGTPASGTLTNCTFPTLNQNTTGTAGGLTGTPDITVGVATASRLNVGTSGTVITTTTVGLVGIGTTNPTTALDVNGDVTIADKIIHGGDTNTAIRFPAADTVSIETAGSERLRITSAGLVGIGTSVPDSLLEVRDSTSSGIISRSSNTQGTNTNKALKVRNNSDTNTFSVSYRGQGYFADSVGIGISAPGAILHTSQTNSGSSVIGAAIRNNVTAASTGVILDLSPSDNSPGVRSAQIEATNNGSNAINLAFKTSNGDVPATRMTLDYLGRLGIGTTLPGTKLHVNTGGVAGNLAYFTDGINSDFYIKTASLIATIGPNAGSTSLAFQTSGTERMRINSSGKVGIGVTIPQQLLHVHSSDGSGGQLQITNASTATTSTDGLLVGYNASNDVIFNNQEATQIKFFTSGLERAAITSGGSILCDSTALIGGDTAPLQADGKTRTALALKGGSNGFFAAFYNTSSTLIGSITGAGGAATFYNTSSDYRIKENVVPLTEAISRVNQLQVHRFNFISHPDQTVDGFIAHEAQEVVPECVTGTKDAVDADGNPVMQGIDQSKLVPLLTAALQEAIAKIEVLEQRLNDAGIN
jgi:hypothetical protein